MALANFIDRATTSASQLLANFELEPFLRTLEGQVVGIGFDAAAAASPEGRATLDLSVRLLARLYPKLAIVPSDGPATALAAGMEAIALAINPDVEFFRDPGAATVALMVGSSAAPFSCTVFHIGSDGWRVRLSTTVPVGSGASGNPVGAGAAACFGAANVFRLIFRSQLERGDRDEGIDLSILTFTAADDGVVTADDVDIGSTHLVGAGAIGNGFLWAARHWVGLSGKLDVVDHEDIDLSNLQRYVLGDQAAVGSPKVKLAAAQLEGTALKVTPHSMDWQSYVAHRGDWHFERVAVALDTARDRVAVQGSLPRWITNAWTQETDLGVSRHVFGEGACLACLYMPAGKVKDQDEMVAEELGMPEARLEVRTLLQTGGAVEPGFVARVATALGVSYEPLAHFVGQPLSTFHQGAICGGIVLKLTGGAAKVKAVVPMSFQSALAGILLLAEVVKHAMQIAPAPTTSTRLDLLRPLAPYLHDPKSRDASGRCICSDSDFRERYRTKYNCSADHLQRLTRLGPDAK